STGPPRELIGALAAGDAARFQAVPGIGKRTAERIIVELREKVAADDAPAPGSRTPIVARRGGAQDPPAPAREGPLGPGHAPAEADGLLAELDGDSAEELIGAALRLARGDAVSG